MPVHRGKPPILALVAIGLMSLSGILYILSMALPYWHVAYAVGIRGPSSRVGHYGLWIGCEMWMYRVTCSPLLLYASGWILAVRALNVLGMMFGTGALILTVIYAFISHDKWTHIFKLSAVVTAICAGLLVMIGDVVYGASINQGKATPYALIATHYTDFSVELSWSFGISVTASIIFIVSAILIGFAKKRRL